MLWCLQASGRRVSYHTFAHVLALDMQFHLQRRTGSLSRMIERGEQATAVISSASLHARQKIAAGMRQLC